MRKRRIDYLIKLIEDVKELFAVKVSISGESTLRIDINAKVTTFWTEDVDFIIRRRYTLNKRFKFKSLYSFITLDEENKLQFVLHTSLNEKELKFLKKKMVIDGMLGDK